jgi:hypothetical protein
MTFLSQILDDASASFARMLSWSLPFMFADQDLAITGIEAG